MTINLKQVIDAVEQANEVYTTFYDTQTGETVYLPDEIITGERDEALEELLETAPTGRFRRFPTKYEIHEYSIMVSFIESLPPGAAYQELAQAKSIVYKPVTLLLRLSGILRKMERLAPGM